MEQDNSLSFLDVLVSRDGNCFTTSVFRKNTFTGLSSSYFSFCDFKFKLNCIKTLLSRGYKVCSNYFAIHKEFEFLKAFFNSNGFPVTLVEKCTTNFLTRLLDGCQTLTVPKKDVFMTLPYFGYQSVKLKNDLTDLINNTFPFIKANIILINNTTIGSFFKFKDRLPSEMQSSLIYMFSCDQTGSSYIGETRRHLFERIADHRGMSWRTDRPLSAPLHSNIREHTLSCQCTLKFDNFKILTTAKHDLDLKILESLYILKNKPNLNSNLTSYPLQIYE